MTTNPSEATERPADSSGPVGKPIGLLELPVFARRLLLFGWDVFAWTASFVVLVFARYSTLLSSGQWDNGLTYLMAAIALQLTWGLASQYYLGRTRIGSFAEATFLGGSVLITSVLLGVVFSVTHGTFPKSMLVAIPVLALTVMVAGRWVFRLLFRNELSRGPAADAVPALIYGAGDIGHQVARLVDTASQPSFRILGYIDDDPGKRFLRVRKYRVLGNGKDAVELARQNGAEMVVLAISNPPSGFIQELSDRCVQAGLKLVVVPPVREMIGGQVKLDQLREFNVADLLSRRPIETDLQAIADYVTGHRVLITGAGGSIGSELALQVSHLGPAKLILLDRDESALHSVQLALYGSGLLDTDDFVLCSIRDHEALQAVFDQHQPEVVFHAAALKHLPMLERYPVEGWKTNVLGTLNVLRCAHRAGVERLVNISTDKAADPTSVLGQTKRLAERLTAWYALKYSRKYLSVRFGNVLGSRGSVLETFRSQIERGGPVTVTHPDVTRYFMTIPEACQLVLQAGAIGRPGDVLVLDMGEPVKIVNVARRLIAESGRDIEIRFTGLRPGEKLDEALFSSTEDGEPSDHPLITRVEAPPLSPGNVLLRDEDSESIMAILRNEARRPASASPRLSARMEPNGRIAAVAEP